MTDLRAGRPAAALQLIIAYKLAKAALMLGVAVWLTFAPGAAYRSAQWVVRELTEGGSAFAWAGRWISAHLTGHLLVRGAELAWLDGLTSTVEAGLLWSGRPWARWIVIASLACLIPFEIHSIVHVPRIGKALVLAANVLIVAYLARAQLRTAGRPGGPAG